MSGPRTSAPWRALPDSLPAEVAYLVGLLREFKDRSGLSLVALAEQTSYSKSSWDRYVNGRTLPPRDAVEALALLVGESAERPLALWELAQTVWSGRIAEPEAADPEPEQEQRPAVPVAPRRRMRLRDWVIAAVAASVAVVGFGVLARALGFVGASAPAPPSFVYTVGCRGAQCDGRNPLANDCGVDAASFGELRVGQAYVELSISDQCQAAWAQVSRSAVGDVVEVTDRNGRTESATVVDQASTVRFVRTSMIAAARHSLVRACLVPRTGARQCTPWGAGLPVPVPPPGRTVSRAVRTAGNSVP